MMLGRKFFFDFGSCGHWGFQIKCFSAYWEMTLRDGDTLEGGMSSSTIWKKAGYSMGVCLMSSLGMEMEI